MKKYLALLVCLLVLMAAQAQDVIIRRNTTTTTTSTTTVTKPKPKPKPKPRTTQPPSVSSQTFTANGISFKMIRVEGGTFMMGSEADGPEKPIHSVTLSSYYIGETEVTQALWQAVMDSNPSGFQGSDRPVEQVTWDEALQFILKLNSLTGKSFRLPTEAEWEFAARGGNKSLRYKYSGSNDLNSVAWFDGNSGNETHPVKGKLPNELGIYDMSGNVWEWCQDLFGNYDSSSQTDPKGATSGSYHVQRGGSCGYNGVWNCRVTNRLWGSPDDRRDIYGFRLAL